MTLNAANNLGKIGAITGNNVTIKSVTALTLMGDINARGAVGAPGLITISTRGNQAAPDKAITLGANVHLISGNGSTTAGNIETNITLDLGGTGGGTFSNGAGTDKFTPLLR